MLFGKEWLDESVEEEEEEHVRLAEESTVHLQTRRLTAETGLTAPAYIHTQTSESSKNWAGNLVICNQTRTRAHFFLPLY